MKPKFSSTSESSGGVVVNSKGEICLTYDLDKKWYIPKGHLENNETLIETAKREIYEETGIKDLKLIKKLGKIERPNTQNPTELKKIHTFLFTTNQTTLKPTEKFTEAGWFKLDEAISNVYTKEEKEFLMKHKDEILPLKNKIKVIVFDFWQTLISGSDRKIIDIIAKELHFKNGKEFWDYCDDNLFAYKTTLNDFFMNLIKKRNIDTSKFTRVKNLFEQGWISVRLYDDTIPTLEKLKGRFKLALLSNTETTTGNHALKLFGLKKYFDEIIFSCNVGLAKPDYRFFQLILDEFLVDPSEVLLIGDHIINDIPPAKKLGFRTILIDRERKHQKYEQADLVVESLNEIDFDSM